MVFPALPKPGDGMAVGFHGFLRFVSSELRNSMKNGHWLPISELCNPCELKYDVIINQEDANRQTNEFLKKNGLDKYGSLDGHQVSSMGKSGGSVSQDFSVGKRFREIQKYYRNNVNEKLVKTVYHRFKLDFELFGYTLEGFVKSRKIIL